MSSSRTRTFHSSTSAARRPTPLPLFAMAALLAAALLAPPADAQGGVGTDEGDLSTFLETVDVDVVNLEVFVTDRRGDPVTGLTRDDFELRVDGEPVELTNFYFAAPPPARDAGEAAGEAAGDRAVAAPSADAAPSPTAGDAATAGPAARPLFLVVYFDNLNTLPSNRKRLIDDLRPKLEERVAAGDQVMLVAFDRNAEIVQPFTRDPAAIGAGLDRIARTTTRRQLADAHLRTLVAQILSTDATAEDVDASIPVRVDLYQAEREMEAITSYRGLQRVITGLAGLPGRKAMLYVSDGVPRYPGAELEVLLNEVLRSSQSLIPQRGSASRRDLRSYYKQLIREANAHGVTLYPFDARGPSPSFGLSAENPTPIVSLSEFEFTRDSSLQEPLLEMAHETGGDAVLNTFNFSDQLTELVAAIQSYYSLGFLSPTPGDGEYHDVEVRVKSDRRLRVRHRDGYLDKSVESRIADRTESFLLQGWQSNPMGVELQFGAPEKKRRRWQVPLLVRVPAGAVTLVPGAEGMEGRLKLFVAVRDGEGRSSEVTRLERIVRIPKAEMDRQAAAGGTQDLGYAVQLEMRPGPQSLVVGVWDEIGGGESYVFQRVVVGGPS